MKDNFGNSFFFYFRVSRRSGWEVIFCRCASWKWNMHVYFLFVLRNMEVGIRSLSFNCGALDQGYRVIVIWFERILQKGIVMNEQIQRMLGMEEVTFPKLESFKQNIHQCCWAIIIIFNVAESGYLGIIVTEIHSWKFVGNQGAFLLHFEFCIRVAELLLFGFDGVSVNGHFLSMELNP